MALTRLQEDLLQELAEQKKTIQRQLEIFEPLAGELRKPAAHRLFSKGTLIMFEIVCYVLAGGMLALSVLLSKVYPFSVWEKIRSSVSVTAETVMTNDTAMQADMENFTIVLHVLCGLSVILFFIIARNLSSVRRKNDIINAVGKDIKTLVGQHLKRKANIQAIESRHFMDSKVADEAAVQKVNDVPNPGYDGEE